MKLVTILAALMTFAFAAHPTYDTLDEVTERVYMDITINGTFAGRLEIALFGNTVPKTVKNFATLVHGVRRQLNFDGTPYDVILPSTAGLTGNLGKPLDYLGTVFHRIVPGFMAQAGDITDFNGMGGDSIYGNDFPDENFKLGHSRSFVLSMANSGPHSNNSQFFITVKPAPWLDGKNVVFGELIGGKDLMQRIVALGTASGQPTAEVKVADCGFISEEKRVFSY